MTEDLQRAIAVLKQGGLILYPTDTVWGIGCDASNSGAVRRIYQLKKRADSKSLILLVDSKQMLAKSVDEIPQEANRIMENAKRPTTIIYPRVGKVASNVKAEDGSVGIRITTEEFSNRLCREFGKPIVSTSANISGEPTPLTFQEISEEIRSGVDYVCLTGRDKSDSSPSNIIKIERNGELSILR